MKLSQMIARSDSHSALGSEAQHQGADRCLTLLIDGMVLNMPELDAANYKAFRAIISQLALQLRDNLPDDDKLALIQKVLHEFEHYRHGADDAIRERISGWRTLVTKLLAELLARLGIEQGSAEAAPLVLRVSSLLTGEEIRAFHTQASNFLRLHSVNASSGEGSSLRVEDHSSTNHNASGLLGGGAAIEHVGRIMERHTSGFVVLFYLGCLDVIGERFGLEAVQDSLMAVSAFLTSCLRNDDAIYHWSDSSLLAILQSPSTEQILGAAMRRIVDKNRDITIFVGGRNVMLRIPLEFEVISIDKLRTANDLKRLSTVSPSNR